MNEKGLKKKKTLWMSYLIKLLILFFPNDERSEISFLNLN